MMQDLQGETRKLRKILIVVVVLGLAGLAYLGQRAAMFRIAESTYRPILASPPELQESYPTESARLDRCEKLLARWSKLENPTIDFDGPVKLPIPLRITGATSIPNPENLRKQAGEIFARDLAALSGRKAAAATLSAWEREIEAWRATMVR